ncbi:MAG: penicillin-binding protein activator LpoB [Planctomycetes bacterium]|nr:penicillin-binding protein activator LpoB [Planctomycetota bacterium]
MHGPIDAGRVFLFAGVILIAAVASGCRGYQYARVVKPGDRDMVGSHQAGGETFRPLVEESVARLLARHAQAPVQPTAYNAESMPRPPVRICFVGVENKSAEEIGDFKEQLYQSIDSKILESGVFQPVSRRYVDAGLRDTRLRPDQLFVPENMRSYSAYMEQQGQPFDYLMYATITSGTTRENKNYQRDYLLTLELIDVRTGQYDKQSAEISKGYHQSRFGRWTASNPLGPK